MFLDGLEDAYEHRLMGTYAEDAARHYQFTRARAGCLRDGVADARQARAGRRRVRRRDRRGEGRRARAARSTIVADEQPRKADPAKIPTLKPAFAKDGTVTAANSSSISDGAAALVLASAERSQEARPEAASRASWRRRATPHEPRWFTTAPVGAIEKVLKRAGWKKDDVDLFEINEAFAVVAMIAMRDLGLPHDKVNVNGGACALGHPIGASGARIIVTLLNALEAPRPEARRRRALHRRRRSDGRGGGASVSILKSAVSPTDAAFKANAAAMANARRRIEIAAWRRPRWAATNVRASAIPNAASCCRATGSSGCSIRARRSWSCRRSPPSACMTATSTAPASSPASAASRAANA